MSSVHNRELHSFPTRRSSDLSQENCFAALVVFANDFPEEQASLRVKTCAGLVEEKHLRVVHHGTRDRETLHQDRKSTRLNSSHTVISYAVFCLKKKKKNKATR